MKRSTLFIGGPADGKRFELDKYVPIAYIHDHVPFVPYTVEEEQVPLVTPREHRYNIEKLYTTREIHYIAVHQSLSDDDVISMLIDGYRN